MSITVCCTCVVDEIMPVIDLEREHQDLNISSIEVVHVTIMVCCRTKLTCHRVVIYICMYVLGCIAIEMIAANTATRGSHTWQCICACQYRISVLPHFDYALVLVCARKLYAHVGYTERSNMSPEPLLVCSNMARWVDARWVVHMLLRFKRVSWISCLQATFCARIHNIRLLARMCGACSASCSLYTFNVARY